MQELTHTPPTASTALTAIKAILQESPRPYKLIFPLVSFVEELIKQVETPVCDSVATGVVLSEDTAHD